MIIIGLGETGLATLRYCVKNNIPVSVVDTRPHPPLLEHFKKEFPDIEVYLGGFPAELKSAKCLIISPGLSQQDPELKKMLSKDAEVIGDIELFARKVTAPVAAITGSNGKSTVTTMLGEMAKASGLAVGVGGNLGPPALSLLSPDTQLYVLELSSFQLETTYTLAPAVATILNVSPDHMDRYPSFQAYMDAKRRIYQNAKAIVVNRLDENLQHFPKNIPQYGYSLSSALNEDYGFQEGILMRGKTHLLHSRELKVVGRHNILNALAALAMAESLNLPLHSSIEALKKFQGLAHRCEWVRTLKSVKWINDSKGTNVGATLAALEGLGPEIQGKWILIAGGLGKNADFKPLLSVVKRYVSAVLLIGEAAPLLQTLFQGTVPTFRVNSMENAVEKAASLAKPNDGVLLSPACASFDMFKNFEDRGQAFKTAVLSL